VASKEYYLKNRDRILLRHAAYRLNNRERLRAYQRSYNKTVDPRVLLLKGAKHRASKFGKPINITITDIVIPDVCPALGVRMFRGVGTMGPNSPTLDCIVPELGYTVGNVVVISAKANSIKQNATPQQIIAVGEWLRRMLKPLH